MWPAWMLVPALSFTFDALPDVSVAGKVVRIAPKASEAGRELPPQWLSWMKSRPKLRWSMTAFVDIEVTD